MSTFYYLREKGKYDELDKYLNFIDNLFSEACEKVKENSLSFKMNCFEDETIKILDNAKREIKSKLIYEEIFVGIENSYGFRFSDGMSINKVKKLCDTGQYYIINEYHEEISFEDFFRKIN